MGEELDSIKEDIKEIKEGIKEITGNVNNLRVLIAGDYITKADFMSEVQKNNQMHSNFTNSLIFISITLLTVFGYFLISGFH
jgi:hypothetical protein